MKLRYGLANPDSILSPKVGREGMANDGGSLLLAFLHLFFIPPPYSPSLEEVFR